MLARSFLSEDVLQREHGITHVERDALITVLGMIERGEIQDRPHSKRSMPVHDGFTMSTFFHSRPVLDEQGYHCGTPACLAGWANHVSCGEAFPELTHCTSIPNPDRLARRLSCQAAELFAVRYSNSAVHRATAEQAGRALASFLTTGEHRWAEALSS